MTSVDYDFSPVGDDLSMRTCGAWGKGKSPEEIDAELDRMRAEWDQDRFST